MSEVGPLYPQQPTFKPHVLILKQADDGLSDGEMSELGGQAL